LQNMLKLRYSKWFILFIFDIFQPLSTLNESTLWGYVQSAIEAMTALIIWHVPPQRVHILKYDPHDAKTTEFMQCPSFRTSEVFHFYKTPTNHPSVIAIFKSASILDSCGRSVYKCHALPGKLEKKIVEQRIQNIILYFQWGVVQKSRCSIACTVIAHESQLQQKLILETLSAYPCDNFD
jgi:hypothetical protein